MRFRELPPSRCLAPWIKCYWILEHDSAEGSDVPERIVPDGSPELIVHYGDPMSELSASGGVERQPKALFAGQLTRPLYLQPTGRLGMVAARFHPDGAQPVMRAPMHELVNRRVALEALCGREAGELADRIATATSDRQCVATLEQFLQDRLARASESLAEEAVQVGTRAILAHGGQITLDRLASLAGLSPRQLERRFQHSVGVSPKVLCRIVRFRQVFDALEGGQPAWPEVAVRCGFYDQAHLIRDFKQFTGEAPTAYLESESWFARCFTQ